MGKRNDGNRDPNLKIDSNDVNMYIEEIHVIGDKAQCNLNKYLYPNQNFSFDKNSKSTTYL